MQFDGRETAWTWIDGRGGQIDISLVDGTGLVQWPFDMIVNAAAEMNRKDGATVRVKESELAGDRCAHLEIDKSADKRVDTFIQRRGTLVYTLTVSVPLYDPDLLARVRAGLRIEPGGPS